MDSQAPPAFGPLQAGGLAGVMGGEFWCGNTSKKTQTQPSQAGGLQGLDNALGMFKKRLQGSTSEMNLG